MKNININLIQEIEDYEEEKNIKESAKKILEQLNNGDSPEKIKETLKTDIYMNLSENSTTENKNEEGESA